MSLIFQGRLGSKVMFIKIVNLIIGLIGYEYVQVNDEYKDVELDVTEEEDWSDLTDATPHYKLIKKKY